MTTAERVELNLLDALFYDLDRPDEPWSVHLELRVEGRLDADRVAAAARAACAAHPIARARLAQVSALGRRRHWEIPDEPDHLSVAVVDCADDADVERARAALLSHAPRLDVGPPFALTLAHHPDGDHLLLNLHHGAGDGLSAFRIMTSLCRAYAGEEDPLPDLDPLAVRDVRELTGSRNVADRVKRMKTLLDFLGESAGTPARVRTAGGEAGAPGYGFALLRLDAEQTRALVARRPAGATVNDLLLGALAVALARFNGGEKRERISFLMPVNLRPPAWWLEVVANFASYVSVSIPAADQGDVAAAATSVAGRTRKLKEGRGAGLLVDMLEFPNLLPHGVKQRLERLLPLTGDRLVDTAVLSNLGRLAVPPDLGEGAGRVTELWFSPPGRMPLGASFGAATLAGELFLTLRYRRALLDGEGAAALLAVVRETLLGA